MLHRHCAWAKWAVHPRPPSQAVAATGHPSRPLSRAPTPIDTQTSLHGGRDHAAHAHQLHERAHLVDIRTRQTLKQSRRIAITDGTDKVRFDLATGEEFPINSLIVEPGHRSAVEPDSPRRYDKVGALQAAVAEGCCFGETGLVDKPGSGVNVLVAEWPKLPRPSSTLPQLTNATVKLSRR